ncbi:hypothetical protein V9T40_013070 [Parthenolecanium corni]|uniref:Uncharacterized protein n=1 Tax=Parthenolecanium corni TaxID=536013 RepID=A0AAN9Y6T6_9HEMI
MVQRYVSPFLLRALSLLLLSYSFVNENAGTEYRLPITDRTHHLLPIGYSPDCRTTSLRRDSIYDVVMLDTQLPCASFSGLSSSPWFGSIPLHIQGQSLSGTWNQKLMKILKLPVYMSSESSGTGCY